jgi:hypothetical protein
METNILRIRKMKTLLSVITIFLSNYIFAQNLDWGLIGDHNSLSWEYSAIGKDNTIITGGYSDELNQYRGTPVLYDADGEVAVDGVYGNKYYVTSFGGDGKLKWSLDFYKSNCELKGITADANGNTYLLVFVQGFQEAEEEMYDEEEEEEQEEEGNKTTRPTGRIPEISDYKFPAGFNILKFNDGGEFQTSVACNLHYEINLEVHEFKYLPSGSFALCGRSDPGVIHKDLSLTMGKGGGDYLMVLDATGKVVWGDAISYMTNSCCTSVATNVRITISKDEKIFITGVFFEGAEFRKKLIKMATIPYDPNGKKTDHYEAYLAAYTKDGKLLWAHAAQTKSVVKSIAVSDKNIVVGINSWESNKLFGENFDTTDKKRNALCIFDLAGKWKNNISYAGTAEDLQFNNAGNIVVVGQNTWSYSSKLFYGKDSLAKRDNIFIAEFSLKGDLVKLRSGYLPVETSQNPLRMYLDSDQKIILLGELFTGMSFTANKFNKAFKAGTLYGGSVFLAKWGD